MPASNPKGEPLTALALHKRDRRRARAHTAAGAYRVPQKAREATHSPTRAGRRVSRDVAPSQGDDRQRHGPARRELPPRGRGLARRAEQRALAAVQAGGAERAERLFARALAASLHTRSTHDLFLTRRTLTSARCPEFRRRRESSNTSAPSARPLSPPLYLSCSRASSSGDGKGAARKRRPSRNLLRRKRRPSGSPYA